MLYKQELRRLRIWFEWMNARPIHEGYNFFWIIEYEYEIESQASSQIQYFYFLRTSQW